MKERTSFGNVLRVCDVLRVCAACTVFALAGEAAFASSENDGDAPAAADVPAAAPVPAAPQPRKWLSLHAYADIETAYVCRGYVWDSRPFSAQYVDAEIDLADFGRLDGYVWTMSALSSKGLSYSSTRMTTCRPVRSCARWMTPRKWLSTAFSASLTP